MKLATVERNGRRWIGAVLDQGATLLDLAAAHQAATGAVSPHFVDMLALIDGGAAWNSVVTSSPAMWSNWKSNASASSGIASCGEGRSSGDPATRRPPRAAAVASSAPPTLL